MKKINLKISLIIFFLLAGVIVGIRPVLAAEIFFGSHALKFDQGNFVEVGVLVNTKNESINALEGQVAYPDDYLTLKSIETGNSLISLWLQAPTSTASGLVDYSGIIPGGYQNNQGYLFTLVFVAKKAGTATINSQSEKILLNDGKGTATAVTRAPLTLQISDQINPQQYAPKQDKQPPEAFTPLISKDKNLFGGQYFLVFATQDKGSGIKEFEIAEQRGHLQKNYSKLSWRTAVSPYQLKDQQLHSNIYVKAIDQSGNERVVSLSASQPMAWYQNYEPLMVCALILLIIIIIISIFLRQKKNGRKK